MSSMVRQIETSDGNISILRKDRLEEVNYNFPGVPLYIRKGTLSGYPGYSFTSHWHEDLEFIAIFSGEMQYNVNGEIFTLRSGEGLVVASRQMHYGFSDARKECSFLCVLLHPLLFSSNHVLEEEYVAPLRDFSPFSFLILRSNVPWQAEIMEQLCRMDKKLADPYPLLALQSLGFAVWDLLFSHACHEREPQKEHASRQLAALKDMLRFIQQRYPEKIYLQDIADAGHLCRSSCSELFQRYLHQSPVRYLNTFRLRRSAELLTQTDLSILETADSCGFENISYFSKAFREFFGVSPREYRRQKAHSFPH